MMLLEWPHISAQTWEASIKILRRFLRGGGNGISEAGIQYGVGGSMILGTHSQTVAVDPSTMTVETSRIANVRNSSRSTLGSLPRDSLIPTNVAVFLGISRETLLERARNVAIDICTSALLLTGHFVRASSSFRGHERFDDVALLPSQYVVDCASGAIDPMNVLAPARIIFLLRFRDGIPGYCEGRCEFALLRLYEEKEDRFLGRRQFVMSPASHTLLVPLSLIYRSIHLVRDPRTSPTLTLFFLQNSRIYDKMNA